MRVKPYMYLRVWGNDFVRPRDITRVIARDRVGNANGVYAIGDPWSWFTRLVTVPAYSNGALNTQMNPHGE